MSLVLPVSIIIRLGAFGLAVMILRRHCDWRLSFLAAMIALMAFRQILTLTLHGVDDHLPFATQAYLDEMPGLLVSLMALASVIFLGRLLDRHRTQEESLRRSEQRFKLLIDASVDRYWEMDEDFRFTTMIQPTGVSYEPGAIDVLGRTRWECAAVEPTASRKWYRHRDDLLAHRPFRDFRYSISDRAGRINHWRVSGSPVYDSSGAFRGYCGTSANETEAIERQRRSERALRASERRYQDLYDNAPVMYASSDWDTRTIMDCNQAFLTATGSERQEVVGRPIADLYHPDCADKLSQVIKSFNRAGEVRGAELRLKQKGGRGIDVILNASAVRDEKGAIRFMRAVWRDVTEQKQAQSALQKSEARFRDFAESASDWYWETGPDLRFTYVSHAGQVAAGLRPRDLLGKARHELPDLISAPAAWGRHLSDLQEHLPFRDFIYGRRLEDGRVVHFKVSGKPLFDPEGGFLGYRGVGTDITQAVEAEQREMRAEARLARAIEAIPAVFALFDRDDRLVLCNRQYREIYETASTPMVPGVEFKDLVRAFAKSGKVSGTKPDVGGWVDRRLGRRSAPARGFVYRRTDDEWTEVSDYVLEDGSIITVGLDISERKRSEDVIRGHQADMAQLLRRSTLDEMAGALAHELNQPLTAVVNFSNGCLRRLRSGTLKTAELSEIMEQFSQQANRASEVLRRVGGFVGHSKLQRGSVDLSAVVDSVAMLLETELRGSDVTLTVDLDRSAPPVLGDRIEIEQVILNLVKNAVEAMRPGSHERRTIRVRSEMRGHESLEIVVEDNGPGFSPRISEKIFDPFVTTKEDGMGMGLSISRTIVEAHGGRIWIPPQDRGGVVRLTLPVYRESLEDAA